jgi:hypothetical protein
MQRSPDNPKTISKCNAVIAKLLVVFKTVQPSSRHATEVSTPVNSSLADMVAFSSDIP